MLLILVLLLMLM